jgi:hypothetical protein
MMLVALLLPLPTASIAQEFPLAEVFAGYSMAILQGKTVSVFDPTVGPVTAEADRQALHGWNASLAVNFTPILGVLVDVGGHYGTLDADFTVGTLPVRAEGDADLHTVAAGPQFSARLPSATVFFRPMAGAAFTRFGEVRATVGNITVSEDVNDSSTNFIWGVGGGVDLRAGERLSVRIVQGDFIRQQGDEVSNNFRLSFGVVFRP